MEFPSTDNVTVAKIAAALQIAMNDARTSTVDGKIAAFEKAYRAISKAAAEADAGQESQDQTGPE